MEIKNVVVIGGGVLGSQIAYQAAYCGFDVTIWLRSEGSIGRCQPKLDHLKEVYHATITLMDSDKGKTPQNWAMGISDYEDFDKEQCLEKANKAYENIKLELDLQKAVSDADLIIESMAENVEQKIDIYKKMASNLKMNLNEEGALAYYRLALNYAIKDYYHRSSLNIQNVQKNIYHYILQIVFGKII